MLEHAELMIVATKVADRLEGLASFVGETIDLRQALVVGDSRQPDEVVPR